MRVLVTGGAGFIGSHLCRALLDAGHMVRVLDNLVGGDAAKLREFGDAVELRIGDIRDAASVRSAVDGVDAVLHHAALPSVPGSVADPVGTAEVNIAGTVVVLEACREAGVRRLIFASSSAVYGEPTTTPLVEDAPLQPLSPYGAHKLAGEHLCRVASLTGGPDTVSFRYFNVYGDNQPADSAYAAVIPAFRQQLRDGKSPVIYGDGEQTRDFVHVSDVAAANLHALRSDEPWNGAVFNVARGEGISIAQLASQLCLLEANGQSARHEPCRAGDIQHSVADVTRLRDQFGWVPVVALDEGLAVTESH